MCLQIKFNHLDEKSTLPLHERRIVSTSFCDFYIKKRRAAWGMRSRRQQERREAAGAQQGRQGWCEKKCHDMGLGGCIKRCEMGCKELPRCLGKSGTQQGRQEQREARGARVSRNSGEKRETARMARNSGARHGDSRTNAQHGAQKQARSMGAARAARSWRKAKSGARDNFS